MPIACQKSYIYLLKIFLKHMDLIIWTIKSLATEKSKKIKTNNNIWDANGNAMTMLFPKIN